MLFETEAGSTAQARLQLMIPLSQHPKREDHKHMPCDLLPRCSLVHFGFEVFL